MSWPDPPSVYKLYNPESSYPPPAAPAIPADITPENVGSFLPEHFARVYAIPDSWKEANGSLIIEANNRVQALTCDMFKKLASIQDDSMSPTLQAQVLEQARTEMSEILLQLQEMQNVSNALRVPQAHLSICAHLSRQIQSRKQQTQRVLAASAELRSVLKSCVNADGVHDAGVPGAVAHQSSIEDVCARLQEALASIQQSSALGASAQAALARDLPHHSLQHERADASAIIMPSTDLPLTLHGQIEELLQLPHTVLDKLPS